MQFLSPFFRLIIITVILLSSIQGSKAIVLSKKRILNRICLTSINTKMQLEGIKPPPGMKRYTCKCFVSEISNGNSISKAKTICKNQAVKKYGL